MKSRSQQLLAKAVKALLCAIEIYNKPDFPYREETFSILALNAWELLLKSKLLADGGNDLRAIYVYERRRTKAGHKSKKQYLRRNRAGNPHTMGLSQLVTQLDKEPATRLSPAIKANIDALTEIRDNSVHYMNASARLAKRILEIGTASVKNFIEISHRWFSLDFSHYSLYLMPIGFVQAPGLATALSFSQDEANLLRYLEEIGSSVDDSARGYHVALEVNVSMKRSTSDPALSVGITNDPDAPVVQLSEKDIRKAYPWDYGGLVCRCRSRYTDFKCNRKFHDIRTPLKQDERFVRTRFLDPRNPRSAKKDFYNPNILKEFDKYYTLRS